MKDDEGRSAPDLLAQGSGGPYRPEARDRVARWYRDQWGYRVNNETTLRHADDALKAVRPEVEWLTAEVKQLREQVEQQHEINAGWVAYGERVKSQRRKYADELAQAIGYEQQRWLPIEAMISLAAERFRGERLKREITSGVMRSLAMRVSEFRRSLAFADAHVPQWERIIAEHKAEVSRLREQLAAQTHVWAPADPTDESATLADALRSVGVVDPDDDCMSVFDTRGEGIKHWAPVDAIAQRATEALNTLHVSASSEASPIVHTVLLSSDTGVMGEWQAFCSGCRQRSVGDLAHAEFWKDQHLADVLVPQALDELSRETQEVFEGRPSGSGVAAPQTWWAGCDEPGPEVTSVRHPNSQVFTRHSYWRAGRGALLTWSELLKHSGGYVLSDASEDAAQAARSEATPKVWRDIRGCEWEEVALHDELRLIRTDPSHQREVGGVSFSRRYVEAHYGPLSEVSCTEQEAEK